MPYCRNCGAKMPDVAKFCIVCGTPMAQMPVEFTTQQAPEAAEPQMPIEITAQQAVNEQTPEPGIQPMQAFAEPAPATKRKLSPLWVVLIILVAALAIIITAAVLLISRGAQSEHLGVYRAAYAQLDGERMDVKQLYPDGFSIALKAGNVCTITVGDGSGAGKWTLNGTEIHVSGCGLDSMGTLANGKLTLNDILDTGVDITFSVNDSDFWSGDWYGWWIIDSAQGEYAGMDDGTYWWDCCATVFSSGDSNTISIWDEDGSSDDTMAYALFDVTDGTTELGCMRSKSGFFWDYEIGEGDWEVDPGSEEFDNLITIHGTYTDPENSSNTFDYTIYLRPWGTLWSDVEEETLPYYYEDWYLPLIEAGEKMPERIN